VICSLLMVMILIKNNAIDKNQLLITVTISH
jgi:hypothetical protein